MKTYIEVPLETIKENWKRYAISSGVTFLSAFLLFAVPELLEESFVWDRTAFVAVILTAIRIGVKAVWEIAKPLLTPKVH